MDDDNRIRELRKAIGLSQSDLAAGAGLHQTQISVLERSVRRLNIESARRIANALGVPMIALFGPRDCVYRPDSDPLAPEPRSVFEEPHTPNRIRELRLAAHMSQEALGQAIGSSKMAISQLERSRMRLDTGYLRKIALALGVSPVELLSERDNPYALTRDEQSLVDLFREIPDVRKGQVLAVVAALLPSTEA